MTKEEYVEVVDKINESITNLNDENVDLVWDAVGVMWGNDEDLVMAQVIN